MKIYIAGAIEKDPHGYMQKFKAAEELLISKGHEAINPTKNIGGTYRELINKGLEQLMRCDAIYLLKGWVISKGAHLEKKYAETTGLKIIMQGENVDEF